MAGALWTVGLTVAGPVAGGLFAANMGAGLTAGGAMATLQSLAMTSFSYIAGAAVGGATAGGASKHIIKAVNEGKSSVAAALRYSISMNIQGRTYLRS